MLLLHRAAVITTIALKAIFKTKSIEAKVMHLHLIRMYTHILMSHIIMIIILMITQLHILINNLIHIMKTDILLKIINIVRSTQVIKPIAMISVSTCHTTINMRKIIQTIMIMMIKMTMMILNKTQFLLLTQHLNQSQIEMMLMIKSTIMMLKMTKTILKMIPKM